MAKQIFNISINLKDPKDIIDNAMEYSVFGSYMKDITLVNTDAKEFFV